MIIFLRTFGFKYPIQVSVIWYFSSHHMVERHVRRDNKIRPLGKIYIEILGNSTINLLFLIFILFFSLLLPKLPIGMV